MDNRSEKYRYLDEEMPSRTKKNQKLYKEIYEDTEYTNIEGVTNIGRTNRIDIKTIQDMLKEPEPIVKKIVPSVAEENEEVLEEERDYDIKDILDKAKETKSSDNKERSLDSVNRLLSKIETTTKKNIEELEKETEYIDTLVNTVSLEKMNDKDFAEAMLNDLKDTGVIEGARVIQTIKDENNEQTLLDTTFFTTTTSLSKEDLNLDIEKEEESSGGMFGIILMLVLILITIAAIVYYFMK